MLMKGLAPALLRAGRAAGRREGVIGPEMPDMVPCGQKKSRTQRCGISLGQVRDYQAAIFFLASDLASFSIALPLSIFSTAASSRAIRSSAFS